MRRFTLLAILFYCFFCGTTVGQKENAPFDIAASSLRYPHHKKWDFQIGAGLQMVLPPKDLLESAIQAPLVNIHMLFGLPWKFSLEGDVTSIIVSNRFALGPHLGFNYKNLGVNFGWDIAFLFGRMKVGGLDNSSSAWIHYPNLTLGYKIKD
ncbi:MAG: hypothetical protein WCO93_10170, partial [bacterium]